MYKHQRSCVECKKLFETNIDRQKFCSRVCNQLNSRLRTGLKREFETLPKGTVGAINELRAAVYLMAQGYEVFRALSPSCSCDLAVLKDGSLRRIEVRTAYVMRETGKVVVSNSEAGKADVLLAISPQGVHLIKGIL